jgi:hypothetical protein
MKKIVVIAGLSMLLLVAMAVPAMAQLDVGVEVGDWFKYEVKVTQWETEMEFLPEGYIGPLTLADNETNWIMYTVTDIVDDNVTFTVTYNWKNGTETEGTMVENVTNSMGLVAIGANMTEGEMVRDEFDFLGFMTWPAAYLNASIMLENPNATRETNVLDYSIDIFGSPYDYLYYWDNATGMLVYYESWGDVAAFDPQPAYTYTVVWELVDSSVDDLLIPDLTAPILLLSLTSITVPIALLHRRKKLIN